MSYLNKKMPSGGLTRKWLVITFSLVILAKAEPILIANGSFENPSDIPSGFTSVAPPSWTATLAPSDVSGVSRLTEPPLATHGLNAAYISANAGGTGSLTYSGASLGNFSDFAAGTRFNFIAAVSGDPGTSFTLELLASGVPVATFTRAGNFKFESIGGVFTLAGQTGAIGVRLSFTNNDEVVRQGLFDNVTLDTTRIVIENHSFENPSSPDEDGGFKNSGTISLTWNSNPGSIYQVETSPDLITWSPWLDGNLLPINYPATGASTSAILTDPLISTTSMYFYRVKSQP